MEFQNLIEKRRSVRKYAEGNTVTKDEILSMIKAAQEAPSWKNSQTGRYEWLAQAKPTSDEETPFLLVSSITVCK